MYPHRERATFADLPIIVVYCKSLEFPKSFNFLRLLTLPTTTPFIESSLFDKKVKIFPLTSIEDKYVRVTQLAF